MRTSKKKICVFVHELNRTGASIVMFDAVSVMLRAGHSVIIVSPVDGVLHEDYEKLGADVFVFQEYCELIQESRIGKHCNVVLPLDEYISKFDQVWCLTVVTAPIIKRYKKIGVPIVWWIHEGLAVVEQYYRCMPKKLSDNVLVLVCSNYSARVLELYKFNYPVGVLHYGIEDTAKCCCNVHSNKVNFVMIGSMCLRKAQDILLSALKYLPKKIMKNTIFTIIGGSKNPEYLDVLYELAGPYDNVKFIPNITRQEVYEYYQRMDCLICPSRDDPMPVVISEAAMFSKPVICSDFVGQADFIREADKDMVFENLSPEELADAICKIYYRNELRELLGEYNRKMYKKYFDYKTMERNVLQIVENL